MAAPTLIRVRVPTGEYVTVELAPRMSGINVERAIALAVGLVVGTFGLWSDGAPRRTAGFHSKLTGDWTAVALPSELVFVGW